MNNIKHFFIEKFYDFLINEKKFFKTHKKIYIVNFLHLLKKNYPQIKIDKNTKEMCLNFYEALFLDPAFKTENFKDILNMKHFLKENNINFNLINQTFLLLANNYIKHIFQTSKIEKLKQLTILLDFYYKFLSSQIQENKTITIPSTIEKIFENKSNIFLFGVYKGIPLSAKTKILSLDKEKATITVRANNYQLIASNFQKEIYFLDLNTNRTFKATISDVIFDKKILVLSEIEEIRRSTLKRNFIRVQPKEKIKAKIVLKNNEYSGTIYDISLKGVSIISKNQIPIHINDIANISFNLEINEKIENFNFSSELRSISKYNDNYRYHFYFEPNINEENKLEKYITNREKEIILELNNYLNREFIEI